MTDPRPAVSVVVPTRNRAGRLRRLLQALAAQEYDPFEVIVVDDASTDETPRILAGWAGENRTALRLDQPSGSYVARNHGWCKARGTVVAFTDDDCVPDPGWLTNLTAAFGGEAVAVQGVTLAEPGEITPFTHQIDQRRPGPPYRTCNMAYRRSILEQEGGFEPLPWYADNILGLRARRLGPIAFAAGAVVRHPPRPRDWRNREAWRARFVADARHRRELQGLGVEPAVVPVRALPVVLWILRPLMKQGPAHLRYLIRHPRRYLAQIGPMMREKWDMVLAMRDWRPDAPGSDRLKLPELSARPLVSVVVVTRRRPHLLAEMLAHMREQRYRDCEIVVVDQGGDSAGEIAATEGVARTLVARGTLGRARQAGVDAARGEIVAFTDDDCLPDPRWLEELVGAFRRQPWLWGVQGRTLAAPGPVGRHAVEVHRPDRLYQTCNIAYRRAALEAVGGFDQEFEGWFEDTALGARVEAYGPIGFSPGAVVRHRAMPRRPFDRERWRRVLADERRLARSYPSFYHRVRGPGFLFVVVARWLLGSPIKTALRELPRGRRNPAGYARLLAGLAQERRELIAVLRELHQPQ